MLKEQTTHQPLSNDLPIYNCHIHTFTRRNSPQDFAKFVILMFLVQHINFALARLLVDTLFLPFWLLARLPIMTRPILWILKNVNPFSDDDPCNRYAALLKTSNDPSQNEIFAEIQKQYPDDATFVVLPMDMKYMELGPVAESLEKQHADLLQLAAASKGRVIPFYAADPRREDLVKQIDENLAPDKFRGVKVYPNLGYRPDDAALMQVYAICQERGYPVIAHCNKGGIYRYALSQTERIQLAHPHNYRVILDKYPQLKLCLAHFGGQDEWDRELTIPKSPASDPTWVALIADMIRSGDYPNLYTDISYTIFRVKSRAPHFRIDYFDYLKSMLMDERMKEHILFGSDYYIVKQEQVSEQQVSAALRRHLEEELYFQIAYHNPKKYLSIQP